MGHIIKPNAPSDAPQPPRHRSCSISPSSSPSEPQKSRRRNTFNVSSGNVDQPADAQPVKSMRRKSQSLADLLWKPRKDEEESNTTSPNDGAPYTEVSGRRQSSRFNSISSVGSAIRKSISKITRRKDSTIDDASSPTTLPKDCGVDETQPKREEMYRYTANLKPLAQNGLLRFENRSDDDILTHSAGPSSYYCRERYLHRKCWLQKSSPYCESTIMNMNIDMGMNLDMNMNMNMNTNKNTDITHKEAGAAPHLWRRRSGQKRGPFARRYKQFTMAKQNGRFSNFGRSKPLKLDRGKGRAIPLSVRLSSGGPVRLSSGSPVRLGKKRGLSVAPSVPLRFAVSKPPNIKSVPNLDDTFSSPDIDSKVPRKSLGARRSASSRTPLRKAPAMSKTAYTVYTSSSSGQSLGHAAPSISSSMRGLYPSPSSSNMVPPFLTIRPVLAERSLSVPKTGLPHPPPQSSFDSTKSISKHPLITRSLLHTYSTPNLPVDMSWSSFPVTRSMTTAADDLSVHSSLDQRRMRNSSGGVLEQFHVDGGGESGLEGEKEDGPCEMACCGGRGRSRVRRGDVWRAYGEGF